MPKSQKPKSKEKELVFIGAKVPAEHAEKLKEWAKAIDLSVSQVLRRIVRDRISEGAGAVTAE